MPWRKGGGAVTHQEAPGATIVLRDDSTYARRHAGLSLVAAAQSSATPPEQLPTLWTGTSNMAASATAVTACYLAVHNVDSSFAQHRAVESAPAKRRTLNQTSQTPAEGLHRLETAVQTRTGSPVLNRPPKRDSFNVSVSLRAAKSRCGRRQRARRPRSHSGRGSAPRGSVPSCGGPW